MRRPISTRRRTGVFALAACLGMMPAASLAEPSPADPNAQADEIVVIGRRSGVPVWRVISPTTTFILAGGIEEVSPETRWDPASLTSALQMADRVIFPQEKDFNASPVAMVGYVSFIRMAKLPKGRSLAGMMPLEQFQRLVALREKSFLKKGFERTHPLHLAFKLHDVMDGKKGFGDGAVEYARRTVKNTS